MKLNDKVEMNEVPGPLKQTFTNQIRHSVVSRQMDRVARSSKREVYVETEKERHGRVWPSMEVDK
ncbi:hypothetical protein K0M31_006993 [Melipona bicolor]|uniref:Uncharacterized protein n=1 Tax=Melipona bicolor TaxID=60889 RepID=A0AA40FRG7_9HYME|nr:hypothetical protein K0M31_006993 [Melipona bicolor]